ncbi:MAG: toll/interleukin-1 receptor domain-containing protein [Lachnospiraceae bacterium]|nr:toll/interleukin-1 receptor domain-containing protein [Lachnospiraceae bacterium]
MSTYMGFEPTQDKKDYYFISYNTEDSSRVGRIAALLSKVIPVWYDYAIPYGESWEKEISVKIAKSKAFLMFFTRGILEKEDSYTQKEFRIAKRKGRTRIVIFLEKITDDQIPDELLAFWDDVTQTQNVYLSDTNDRITSCREILKALKLSEKEINDFIEKINDTDATEGGISLNISDGTGRTEAKKGINGAGQAQEAYENDIAEPNDLEPAIEINVIPPHKVGLFGTGYTTEEKKKIRNDGLNLLKEYHAQLKTEINKQKPDGYAAYRLSKSAMIIIHEQLGAYNFWNYNEDQAMNLFRKNYEVNLTDIRNYIVNHGRHLPADKLNLVKQILYGIDDIINIMNR